LYFLPSVDQVVGKFLLNKPMTHNWFGRMYSHTGILNGPDSFERQQWGILGNGRKSDPAISRGVGRLVLKYPRFSEDYDVN